MMNYYQLKCFSLFYVLTFFRALLLVQSGVKEINTTQLKEAVTILKQRAGEQLEVLGEDKSKKSDEEKGSESQGEEKAGSSEESRKSSDE